ncbi:MAG: histidinol-phosphate transaminase [Firmicutes bacterium]|nr:histidinol-phosphate transaminase [Bacillota bacterium]
MDMKQAVSTRETAALRLARPALAQLQPFEPELPDLPIEKMERVLGKNRVIKLSFNENPYGPSPRAIEAMQRELGYLHLYQDSKGDDLRRAIAADLEVEPDQIILTNGADELILLTALAFLEPDDEVIIPSPTFGQYRASSLAMGARPVSVPLTDFRVDIENILQALSSRTKIVFLCNPNNPTGTVITQDELDRLIQRLPENVLLVIDEAYIDFVTEPSCACGVNSLAQRGNLLVIRTFSKIHGLAAARIGFGISHTPLINALERVKPPFNVNRIGQAGALASWQDKDYLEKMRKLNASNREYLYTLLNTAEMSYVPSQTNFVLADGKQDAAVVFRKLAESGIIVRSGTGYGLPHHLRITIGRKEDLTRLGEVLQNCRVSQEKNS